MKLQEAFDLINEIQNKTGGDCFLSVYNDLIIRVYKNNRGAEVIISPKEFDYTSVELIVVSLNRSLKDETTRIF